MRSYVILPVLLWQLILVFLDLRLYIQAYRYIADNRDNDKSSRFNIIDERHGIWRCHFAGSCSVVCTKGRYNAAVGIQLLKGHMLRNIKKQEKDFKFTEQKIKNKQNHKLSFPSLFNYLNKAIIVINF